MQVRGGGEDGDNPQEKVISHRSRWGSRQLETVHSNAWALLVLFILVYDLNVEVDKDKLHVYAVHMGVHISSNLVHNP